MQALDMNWIGKRRHVSLAGLLLALAAAMSVGATLFDYGEVDAEWQVLQARKSRLNHAGKPPKSSGVAGASQAREEAPSIAQIDVRLQRPWDALLHALEQHQVKDVALISVEAQGDSGSLHLVGEARDMEHALAYVRSLREAPQLHHVFLSGQEEKQVNGVQMLRFSLDASWSNAQ